MPSDRHAVYRHAYVDTHIRIHWRMRRDIRRRGRRYKKVVLAGLCIPGCAVGDGRRALKKKVLASLDYTPSKYEALEMIWEADENQDGGAITIYGHNCVIAITMGPVTLIGRLV